MRFDSLPEYHAELVPQSTRAVIICETVTGTKQVGKKRYPVTSVEIIDRAGMPHRSIRLAAPDAFDTFDQAQERVRFLREQDKQHYQRKDR